MLFRKFSTTSNVTKQSAKILNYSIQSKEYTLQDLENVWDYLGKRNVLSTKRVYLLNNYPTDQKDESLMSFRSPQEAKADEGETTTQSQTYGSDTYASLASLKAELSCDTILGVRYVDGTPTNVSPVVKEAKDYMRTKETRDNLQVLFVPNIEALRTALGQQDSPTADFDEAYIDQQNPQESFSKTSQVSNAPLMLLIVLNFALLIGISVYNFWQFRIVTGLDTPQPSAQKAKFGLPPVKPNALSS